jgi:hypothetical protein
MADCVRRNEALASIARERRKEMKDMKQMNELSSDDVWLIIRRKRRLYLAKSRGQCDNCDDKRGTIY